MRLRCGAAPGGLADYLGTMSQPEAARIARIVLASHNPGKLREIAALLAPYGVEVTSAGELGLPEPEETEATFRGNALIKARAAASAAGLPALSDDSGLEILALAGAPGVWSADWAGQPRDFGRAMAEALRQLAETGSEDRSARFVCALAFVEPDGTERVFEGEVRGSIAPAPKGERGFGYDPVFIPNGYQETFGELDSDTKHKMSHRADAFAQFVAAVLA
jgi:XTP/dITP diphosphohydrolase